MYLRFGCWIWCSLFPIINIWFLIKQDSYIFLLKKHDLYIHDCFALVMISPVLHSPCVLVCPSYDQSSVTLVMCVCFRRGQSDPGGSWPAQELADDHTHQQGQQGQGQALVFSLLVMHHMNLLTLTKWMTVKVW